MDIGFEDIIVPKTMQVEVPTLLDENPSGIKAYLIESIISERNLKRECNILYASIV